MTWRLVSSVEFLSFSKDPSLTMCVTEANYGFTAVPSSATALLATDPPKIPASFTQVSQSPIPSTPLAQRIDVYAKAHLPEPTYNHCLRVYHYGLAIRQYRFPE